MSFLSLRLKVLAFTHLASALPDERISKDDLSGLICILASRKTVNKQPMRVHILMRSWWLVRSNDTKKSSANTVMACEIQGSGEPRCENWARRSES